MTVMCKNDSLPAASYPPLLDFVGSPHTAAPAPQNHHHYNRGRPWRAETRTNTMRIHEGRKLDDRILDRHESRQIEKSHMYIRNLLWFSKNIVSVTSITTNISVFFLSFFPKKHQKPCIYMNIVKCTKIQFIYFIERKRQKRCLMYLEFYCCSVICAISSNL